MAMPSARPTKTMARPNISGRSLMAARAADPVYATAMAAPMDDPATAMAVAMSQVIIRPPSLTDCKFPRLELPALGSEDAGEYLVVLEPESLHASHERFQREGDGIPRQ